MVYTVVHTGSSVLDASAREMGGAGYRAHCLRLGGPAGGTVGYVLKTQAAGDIVQASLVRYAIRRGLTTP